MNAKASQIFGNQFVIFAFFAPTSCLYIILNYLLSKNDCPGICKTMTSTTILKIRTDRDRRDFTYRTMGRSSFVIRPTKNRSGLSNDSTMDRILFFWSPRVS